MVSNKDNTEQVQDDTDSMGFEFIQETNPEIERLQEENKILQDTLVQLKYELDRVRQPPLMVCEVVEELDDGRVVIRTPNGNNFLVNKITDKLALTSNDTVYCDQKNLSILEIGSKSKKFNVEQFVIIEKPNIKWSDVGGLSVQVEEIKEVIELPLKKPEIFKKIGIKPPKGVLLHGPPGTGKTLLAKAVAAATKSTFIEIVGSELVMKFIGEGSKLVKEVFDLAREKAPSIVFIDEIDSIAATRIETGTSGEREVQRTFMQLLAEIDGFNNLDNVKIIGCTNRIDILDPAVIRPGRLDRLIKVDNPTDEGIQEIFKIHTQNMSIKKGTSFEKIYAQMSGFSGAEIQAVATEAGYFAIREKHTIITEQDFLRAIEKVRRNEKDEDFGRMFG
ncbi:AAA family ATPase [Candidatus Woesearchaeota archaeon]|nr:AAA family ATPase [Candidatus Woesearchaeota archaeon]